MVFFIRSSSTHSPLINHSGQDSLTKIVFYELQYFGLDLRLARTKTAIPIRSVQNVDCRLQTGCKMQTENYTVFSSDTCLLTTYRASRNRFSAIVSHDYYPLARFLITVVLNIISSLHIVFSLCARVGWCDVCPECTN